MCVFLYVYFLCSDIEDHTDVFESVGNLYWKKIASRLRIDYDMMEGINRDEDTSEDKMMAVLAAWLRRRAKRQEKPSWRSLCVAIQALDKSKAEEIAERHKCDCKECCGNLLLSVICIIIINLCFEHNHLYRQVSRTFF